MDDMKYVEYVLKVLYPEVLVKIYMDVIGVDRDEAERHMLDFTADLTMMPDLGML